MPVDASFKTGKLVHGFSVQRVDELPCLCSRMVQLSHRKTGAKWIHLANEDVNNCFAVAFLTLPTDSTGVAHILEHTALCGSRNYPVRDPFFSMNRRSLKTFMNAFTAPEWTMYPFATQNERDFYHLMSVYLDAAFFPQLKEIAFRQEGHRLEFSNGVDSDLILKGVVYNEMQGALSQPERVLNENIARALYSSAPYRYNSGGDPQKIIELTHRELVDFHCQYYHPSNAYFFSYGHLDLTQHLAYVEKELLSRFDAILPRPYVLPEKRRQKPRLLIDSYPINQEEDDGEKCLVTECWLTASITNEIDILALSLLEEILLGHGAAPLRKALLESGLGKSLTNLSGFESDLRDTWFAIGLEGVKEDRFEDFSSFINEFFLEIFNKGVKNEEIESALHRMEIGTREISGGHYPYGLDLLFRFFGSWIHGGDPIIAIDFDRAIVKLRERLRQPEWFKNQIKYWFIDNKHRATVRLLPSHSLEKKRQKLLQSLLKTKKDNMSPKEQENIIDFSNELKKYQQASEDLSVLPSLGVRDIPRTIQFLDPITENFRGENLTFYEQPTNGLVYVHWYVPIPDMSFTSMLDLPFLNSCITRVGAGSKTWEDMSKEVNRFTGGFSAGMVMDIFPNNGGYKQSFGFSGKALSRHTGELFRLAQEILTGFRLNETNRLQMLLKERSHTLINSLLESGHQYASLHAASTLTMASAIDECYSGIRQIQHMKRSTEENFQTFLQRLQAASSFLKSFWQRESFKILVIGDRKALSLAEKKALDFLDFFRHFREKSQKISPLSFEPNYLKEAWLTSTPISYVARCIKTPTYFHPDASKLFVLSKLLTAEFLHTEIREKGGAYGGFALFQPIGGIFSLISYRDPNLQCTLEILTKKASQWIAKGLFDERVVLEAILQTISAMDVPLSPAGKALHEYRLLQIGLTKEKRLEFRDRVLRTTKSDLQRVGNLYLKKPSSLVALTSEDIFQREENIFQLKPCSI